MKYKLQLILIAFGILLTTVCHAQDVKPYQVSYSVTTNDIVNVELQNAEGSKILLACSSSAPKCLMPVSGEPTYVMREPETAKKSYPGTNIVVAFYGLTRDVGVYRLIRSYGP